MKYKEINDMAYNYNTPIKYQYKSKNDFEWHDCPEREVNPYLKYAYEIKVVRDFKSCAG